MREITEAGQWPGVAMSKAQRQQASAGLALVPYQDREDAAQEAYLALLTGKTPVQGIDAYRHREQRYRRRFCG